MITIIFRIRIKDGKEAEALAEVEKMVAAVEANEPGALAYVYHRVLDDPMQLVLFESYVNDEALQAHVKTPYFVASQAAFPDLFDTSDIQAERLERIAGVVRG